jgi:LCP family protein required for cell wall assembly
MAEGDGRPENRPGGPVLAARPRNQWLWRRLTRRGKVVVSGGTALMLVSGCAGGLYLKLAGNIGVEAIDVVGARPTDSGVGQNILVLGSQSRAGQVGATLGDRGDSEELSDTAMLVHLSGDMKHAVVTSIPRDLIVPRPACVSRKADYRLIPASAGDMFNRAMNLGGPSCAVATVEHMTNLRVDHFIKVNFNGFRGIVDALGGIDVCVPAPGIHDWRSGLNLDPGRHTIRDQEALAFVRDRHGVGGGGDLDRIKMQQAFLSSLAQKVQSAGTLSNPVTLYKLANAATASLTVDPGLGSIRKLVSLARQLRGLTTHDITFITAPTTDDPNNRNRVVPMQPGFDQIFQDMSADRPIDASAFRPAKRSSAAAVRVQSLHPVNGAAAVLVRVLNATHRRGQAAEVAKGLRRMGFRVVGVGSTHAGSATGLSAGEGDTLLKSVLRGPVAAQPTPGKQHGLTLTIGTDFGGLHQPTAASGTNLAPDPSADTGDSATANANGDAPGADSTADALPAALARSADGDICSGLPKPRGDAAVKPRPAPKPAPTALPGALGDQPGADPSAVLAPVAPAVPTPVAPRPEGAQPQLKETRPNG